MIDLVCRKSCEATEFTISVMLFLSAEDAVAVIITIGKDDAVAVGYFRPLNSKLA